MAAAGRHSAHLSNLQSRQDKFANEIGLVFWMEDFKHLVDHSGDAGSMTIQYIFNHLKP